MKNNTEYKELLDKAIFHLEKAYEENKKMRTIISLQKRWIKVLEGNQIKHNETEIKI